MCCSSASSPICTATRRRCCSTRAICRTGRHSARSRRGMPDCVVLSDAANHASMIEGIRAQPRGKAHFRPQRPRRPRTQARRLDPHAAEAGRLRIRLFDGRRYRADRRNLRRRRTHYGAMTYLDEVHARRPVRPARRRDRRARRRRHRLTVIEGTLAKAFGVVGGYIAGIGGAVRFRPQLRLRLHLHHRRCRRRSPPARSPASAISRPARERDASRIAWRVAPAPRRGRCAAPRQSQPHRSGDGRRSRVCKQISDAAARPVRDLCAADQLSDRAARHRAAADHASPPIPMPISST